MNIIFLWYDKVYFGAHSIVLFSIGVSNKQEYVLWNAVSVPLLQFARYCSIVQKLWLPATPAIR